MTAILTMMGLGAGQFGDKTAGFRDRRRRRRKLRARVPTKNPKSPWIAHVALSGYITLYMPPNEKSTTDAVTEQPDQEESDAEEGAEEMADRPGESMAGDERFDGNAGSQRDRRDARGKRMQGLYAARLHRSPDSTVAGHGRPGRERERSTKNLEVTQQTTASPTRGPVPATRSRSAL